MKKTKKTHHRFCKHPFHFPNKLLLVHRFISFVIAFLFVFGHTCPAFAVCLHTPLSSSLIAKTSTGNKLVKGITSTSAISSFIQTKVDKAIAEHKATVLMAENETLKSQLSSIGNDFLTSVKNFYFPVRVTYYCPCSYCSGPYTASGRSPKAGRTIATDSRIPFGTVIMIDTETTTFSPCIDGIPIGKHEFTVDDRGGAVKGAHIDIFVNSHSEALANGTHTVYCKIVSVPENLSENEKQKLIQFLTQVSH